MSFALFSLQAPNAIYGTDADIALTSADKDVVTTAEELELKVSGQKRVLLGFLPQVQTDSATIRAAYGGTPTSVVFTVLFYRDATVVARIRLGRMTDLSGATSLFDAGAVWALDLPAAGTYTWAAKLHFDYSGSVTSITYNLENTRFFVAEQTD